MDPIKLLQLQLQEAYNQTPTFCLSERNVVDILNLIGIKDLIYTADGKEIVTPKRLDAEIRQQIHASGGRVNVLDLTSLLNVPLQHIEARATHIAAKDRSILFYQGELISKNHFDSISEEINDILQEQGEVAIIDLARRFSLGTDILQDMILERLGTKIHGKLEANSLVTDVLKQKYTALVRGALCGATLFASAIICLSFLRLLCLSTRPVDLYTLATRLDIPQPMVSTIAHNLVSNKILNGEIHRHDRKQIYVPQIFNKARTEWMTNFFKQNGYIALDTIAKLGMDTRIATIKNTLGPTAVELRSCIVSQTSIAAIDEAILSNLQNSLVTDVSSLAHPSLTAEDIARLIEHCPSAKKAVILGDLYVVPHSTIQNLLEAYSRELEQVLRTYGPTGKLNSYIFSTSLRQRNDPDFLTETKKPRVKQSNAPDEHNQAELRKLFVNETKEWLRITGTPEIKSDSKLIDLLAEELRPHMEERLLNISPVTYVKSIQYQRKQRAPQFKEKLDVLLYNIHLFYSGLKQVEDENDRMDLELYLMKTLCADVLQHIADDLADGYSLQRLVVEKKAEFIHQLPPELAKSVSRLIEAQNKGVSMFILVLHEEADPLELELQTPNKKTLRALLKHHKLNSLQQLEKESNPVNVFRLVLSVLYITHLQSLIYTSAKLAHIMLKRLEPCLGKPELDLLRTFHNTLNKYWNEKENSPDSTTAKQLFSELTSNADDIKRLARES